MNALERCEVDILEFAKTKTSIKAIRQVFGRLARENAKDVTANCEVRDLKVEAVDVTDLSDGEDYEGNPVVKLEGLEGYVKEFTTQDGLDGEIEAVKSALADLENVVDDRRGAVKNRMEKRIAELEDVLWALERPSWGRQEIYGCTVWIYSKIDEEAAAKACVSVGRFLRGPNEGEEFICLGGCGMDMTPTLAVYEALVYGAVQLKHVEVFREPKYAESFFDPKVWRKAVERLGIAHCMKTAVKKAKKRMARFESTLGAITKARDAGQMDSTLAGLAAMSAVASVRRD